MQLATVAATPAIRTADRQALPKLPAPATLTKVEYDDPRLAKAFEDPEFDSIEFSGELAEGSDWPMDFIYGPHVNHAGSKDFLATVAAAAKLAGGQYGGVTAVMQGRDGVYYLDDQLSAGFYGDGGGDWELSEGDLASVSVDAPEVVAVVDASGWFDLRLASR
jgi:hypothetical protein